MNFEMCVAVGVVMNDKGQIFVTKNGPEKCNLAEIPTWPPIGESR